MTETDGEAVERSKNLGDLTSHMAFESVKETGAGRSREEKMLFLLFIILAAISICIGVLGGFWEIRLGWSGFEETDRLHYSYIFFTGSISKQLTIEDESLLTLHYDIKVDRGSLTISIIKMPSQTLWKHKFGQNSSGSIKIGLDGRGVYSIIVRGEGTEGEFDLRWKVS